jgi:hypothetical protein
MPELPRCIYCGQTVDEEKDKYVRLDGTAEKPLGSPTQLVTMPWRAR